MVKGLCIHTHISDCWPRLTVVYLGHPNHGVEHFFLKKRLPRRDSNRGPMARLNVTLDRAATTAGQVY